MAKKASGLGRGLGDLFEDNAPEVGKSTAKVVVRHPDGDKNMRSGPDIYDKDKIPKNRSVLRNFKNNNR